VLDPEVVSKALDFALRELEEPATAVEARSDILKAELVRTGSGADPLRGGDR